MNEKIAVLDIILTVLAFITPIIVMIIGFLLKDRLKRIDTDVASAKKDAYNALAKSSEIETNYNTKFAEVNRNIHDIEQGLHKSIDEVKSTTISRLFHMEKEITSRLHLIQVSILTGKIEALTEDIKKSAESHDPQT